MEANNRDAHIKKLAIAFLKDAFYVDNESGLLTFDNFRPLGNRDILGDVLETIGCEKQSEYWSDDQLDYAKELYNSISKYLIELVKN